MHGVQETYVDFLLAGDLFLWPSRRDTDIADPKKIAQHHSADWYCPTCELLMDGTATLWFVFHVISWREREGAVLAYFSKYCADGNFKFLMNWTELQGTHSLQFLVLSLKLMALSSSVERFFSLVTLQWVSGSCRGSESFQTWLGQGYFVPAGPRGRWWESTWQWI